MICDQVTKGKCPTNTNINTSTSRTIYSDDPLTRSLPRPPRAEKGGALTLEGDVSIVDASRESVLLYPKTILFYSILVYL